MSVFEENINDLYDRFEELLAEADCEITAAEFQGILCGMISAGLQRSSLSWLEQINALINENNGFSNELSQFTKMLVEESHQAFADDDLLAPILIPDDSYPMVDRLESLSFWSQGFLLGFGLQFGDKNALQNEIKESLTDIAEISQVSIKNDDNEEEKMALETLVEHIKVAVKMIYMELVRNPKSESKLSAQKAGSKTVH